MPDIDDRSFLSYAVYVIHTRTRKLTKEEMKEYKEVFNFMDLDGSGSIDADELRSLMISLGIDKSQEEVQDMIDEVRWFQCFSVYCVCMTSSEEYVPVERQLRMHRCRCLSHIHTTV